MPLCWYGAPLRAAIRAPTGFGQREPAEVTRGDKLPFLSQSFRYWWAAGFDSSKTRSVLTIPSKKTPALRNKRALFPVCISEGIDRRSQVSREHRPMTYEQFSEFVRQTPEWAAASCAIRAEVRTEFATRPSDRDFEDLALRVVVSVHGPHYAGRIPQVYGPSLH
jgi:hypothetical protein